MRIASPASKIFSLHLLAFSSNTDLAWLTRLISFYFSNPSEQHHSGKLTEEEKTRICYTVGCTKLSPHLLMHLVQNPRLPLRFVVQAMLVDNLHTRRSILLNPAAAAAANPLKPHLDSRRRRHDNKNSNKNNNNNNGCHQQPTLGDVLRRDAALRQSAHLRASMEATSSRIRSLERDLAGLRRQLRWSEAKRAEMESARSVSFRIVRPRHGEEEEEEEEEEAADYDGSSRAMVPLEKSCDGNSSSKNGRRFGQKLMHGLRSMFRKGGSGSSREEGSCPGHRRSRSFT